MKGVIVIMTNEDGKNPCLTCDCYEPDMGCTMPSIDKNYACHLEKNTVTEFFMAMKPPTTTHHTKSVAVINGKPHHYEDAKLKAARLKLESHLWKHRPEEPYTGPVRVITKWCFSRGKHKDGEWKTTRPDVTNLQKLLEDCMTKVGFWKDDNIIVSSIVEKFWAEVPGIYIRIEEV